MRRGPTVILLVATFAAGSIWVAGQTGAALPLDHPAIAYRTRETTDAVAALNRKMQSGETALSFDSRLGYLASVLRAFDIPVESQTLVFSPTSRRADIITETSPRALYFNDTVAVGWEQRGDVVEVAALDPEQGVVFWTLPQTEQAKPQFVRSTQCLECHLRDYTAGVPGLLVMSMLPLADNPNDYAQGWSVDQRTPIEDRWGGWYVTGSRVPPTHLGNVTVYHAARSYVRLPAAPVLATAAGKIADGFLAPYSDVVALLVLNHQVKMADLITHLGWEARLAASRAPAQGGDLTPAVRDAVEELVDYMLFVDEAPLPTAVKGSSGFAEAFSKRGPRDAKGRSLRDFDLDHRTFRYPCSYMIYTEAFDALPAGAREAVYARLWSILSGQDQNARYSRLSSADRSAVIDILRDTKKGLPSYFQANVLH